MYVYLDYNTVLSDFDFYLKREFESNSHDELSMYVIEYLSHMDMLFI